MPIPSVLPVLHRRSLSTKQGSDTGTDEELEMPERAAVGQQVLRVRVAAEGEEKTCPGSRQRQVWPLPCPWFACRALPTLVSLKIRHLQSNGWAPAPQGSRKLMCHPRVTNNLPAGGK